MEQSTEDLLERYRLPKSFVVPSGVRERPRRRRGEKFLKGPIPWPWLVLACRGPGKTLHVAMALWFLYGVSRDRAPVALTRQVLAEFRVSPRAAHRGLAALERAGLVAVVRHRGRLPRVTLLEVTDVAILMDSST